MVMNSMEQQAIHEKENTERHELANLRQTISNDLAVHRGVPIPSHMKTPGQDGYRTPTVEDYELHLRSTSQESQQVPIHDGSKLAAPPQERPTGRPRSPLTASFITLLPLLEKLHWKERLRHFTWSWFTLTMSTGGIANVLYNVPFRFPGLYAIGVVFFLLNVLFFVIIVSLISLRFYLYPEMFKASFAHPTERLFIPASVVSFGTILINVSQYGPDHTGPWLMKAVAVLFWFDCALAIMASSIVYLIMWSTASFTIERMTPIWIFPAYPLLIVGPHASVLSSTLGQAEAFDIIVGGFTIQGIGFLVALMIYASFLYRLMTQKLPQESARPGMFVSVGPSGFTVAGVIGMAEHAERALPPGFMGDSKLTATILRVVASWSCLWIWGLAFWFFFVSIGAHWSCVERRQLTFAMSWFSFVFPNTALITATFAIGKAFDARAIQIIGCVMTPMVITVWIVVCFMMVRAIILKQILWPQKDEDRDEGGFVGPEKRKPSKNTQDPRTGTV